MSAVKKSPLTQSVPKKTADPSIQRDKQEVIRMKELLTRSIIDNPKTAKKSALILSLWVSGKTTRKQKR